MCRSEAEDAGGLLSVKDNNEAAAHFNRRTLCFFNCGNYKAHMQWGQLSSPQERPSQGMPFRS